MIGPLLILLLGLSDGAPTPVLQDEPGSSPAPAATTEATDRFRIEISNEMLARIGASRGVPSPRAPRLILFLAEHDGPVGDLEPLDAPFFRRPQPIRSIPLDLDALDPVVELEDGSSDLRSVPERWDRLNGRFRVRAVVDLGFGRGHEHPSHPVSDMTLIDLASDRDDLVELTVDRCLPGSERIVPDEDLVWIERPSPMLSEALGRPIAHRAAVVLPPGYRDTGADRRFWPVIYRIPGFGGDHTTAEDIAGMYRDPAMRSSLPAAVWVVLDPEDVLGHHGFVDGENMGPRGTAFVEELIPWLQRRFRLLDGPEARMLHGHSSGGWSALWLLVKHPDVFGSAFASAPDPVDFSRFGTVDLYADDSLFVDDAGRERPSYRRPIAPEIDRVAMTIREEIAMEQAIAPDLRSGEQWGAWNAMFSGRDPRTGRPRLAFDPETGTIDREAIERDWSRFDLTAMVRADPEGVGRILRERARILCGDRDSFYLERAVESLQTALDEATRTHGLPLGPGYVQIVPNATHGSIAGTAMQRWMREMGDIADRTPDR